MRDYPTILVVASLIVILWAVAFAVIYAMYKFIREEAMIARAWHLPSDDILSGDVAKSVAAECYIIAEAMLEERKE